MDGDLAEEAQTVPGGSVQHLQRVQELREERRGRGVRLLEQRLGRRPSRIVLLEQEQYLGAGSIEKRPRMRMGRRWLHPATPSSRSPAPRHSCSGDLLSFIIAYLHFTLLESLTIPLLAVHRRYQVRTRATHRLGTGTALADRATSVSREKHRSRDYICSRREICWQVDDCDGNRSIVSVVSVAYSSLHLSSNIYDSFIVT